MAEIRINATGGVKLYDADDSHYAQIVAGTITSNVDAITLGHDTVTIADNLSLGSDSSVLKFGADGDTTLTHTDGTGLTLDSTNKLCFNDASQYIQGASNAILDIAATDEIELNATLVDINANVEISGTATTTGVHTFSATPVFPDGSLALADLDIDGGTDIGAAIVDADLLIIDDGAGGTNRKTAASRLKTYIGGGITAASQWRITSDLTGDADPVSANLEAVDTDPQGALGSAMTESSGVFTFPSTGFWWVKCAVCFNSSNSADDVTIQIQGTTDNGTDGWPDQAAAFSDANASSFQTSAVDSIIDVTNTSNVKVRFKIPQSDNSNISSGHTYQNETWFTFLRLGDT